MDMTLNPATHLSNLLSWFLRADAPTVARRTAVDPLDHLQTLDRGTTLRVEEPIGMEVVCVQGTLWITHDHDPKDIVVEAGHSYVADRHASLVVYALDKSRFLLHPRSADEA